MFVTVRIALLVSLSGLCTMNHAMAAQVADNPATLTVTLNSGRTFAGAVDVRTAADALVLRFGNGKQSILRPIRWESIAAARHADVAVSLDELRALAEKIKTSAPVQRPAAPPPPHLPMTAAERAVPSQVAAIHFDAAIANWDPDVESDGLLLRLMPSDNNGQLTAASGNVEVELFASQRRTFHHAPQSGGYSTERIGHWTVPVVRDAFGENGIALRLPFQAMHPEFRHDLHWYGLVHVRFTVPGSGVFEHSQDALALQPYTPVRDALQQNTGRRFLPTETTGREKNDLLWRP